MLVLHERYLITETEKHRCICMRIIMEKYQSKRISSMCRNKDPGFYADAMHALTQIRNDLLKLDALLSVKPILDILLV